MASRKKSDYHRQMTERVDETASFVRDNKFQEERERCACAAFLRCLGVPFSVTGLVRGENPPDIIFDGAHFEVREAFDKGRKRDAEVTAWQRRSQQARTDEDWYLPQPGEKSLGPYGSLEPRLLSLAEIYDLVPEALAKKSKHYAIAVLADLDALVCIELLNNSLLPALPVPCYDALLQQGWRSVSFLMPPYSHVIYAKKSAPTFLQEYQGQTRNASPHPDLFSLEPEASLPGN